MKNPLVFTWKFQWNPTVVTAQDLFRVVKVWTLPGVWKLGGKPTVGLYRPEGALQLRIFPPSQSVLESMWKVGAPNPFSACSMCR